MATIEFITINLAAFVTNSVIIIMIKDALKT